MIVSFATGRLGNQLFEYAHILSQAKPKERIHLYFFDDMYTIFDIKRYHYHPGSQNKFSSWFHHKLWRFFIKLREKNSINWIKEDTETNLVKTNIINSCITFIEGYFQNDNFITPELLQTLSIKQIFTKQGDNIIATFPNNKRLCFIHVRHGDYDTGMRLPESYYLSALQKFDLENTFFYITGDDPLWEETFFSFLPNKTISNNKMAVDLYIMSKCQGGILSNSTFAYWGAILGVKNKEIYAPEYWMGYTDKKWIPSDRIKTNRFFYVK